MNEFPFLSIDDINMNININLDSLLIFFNNDYNDYMSESTETMEDPDPDYIHIPDMDDSDNYSDFSD
jgi:hypothetical protein